MDGRTGMIIVAVVIIAIILFIKKRKKGAEEVPQGLQVFDNQGNVVVDVTDRLTKVLGTATIPANTTSGTISNPLIVSDVSIWYVITKITFDERWTRMDAVMGLPVFTQVDGGIHWEYVPEQGYYYKAGVEIIYGVY